jgi:SPP1 family predicted phage head-tail adaptor
MKPIIESAGKLRHRLQLWEDRGTVQDSLNHIIPVPFQVTEVWGAIETLTGRELYDARQVIPDVTHKITVRYRNVTPKQWLTYKGRKFNVDWVNNVDERNFTITALCQEQV